MPDAGHPLATHIAYHHRGSSIINERRGQPQKRRFFDIAYKNKNHPKNSVRPTCHSPSIVHAGEESCILNVFQLHFLLPCRHDTACLFRAPKIPPTRRTSPILHSVGASASRKAPSLDPPFVLTGFVRKCPSPPGSTRPSAEGWESLGTLLAARGRPARSGPTMIVIH